MEEIIRPIHSRVQSQALHAAAIEAARFQSGVLPRKQLLTLGFTDDRLRSFVKTRRLAKIAPGVYNTVTGEPTIDVLRWAAHLLCGPRSYVFGRSALQVWGLGRPDREVTMAVPRGGRCSGASWVTCVQTVADRQVVSFGELPVEAPADALIDASEAIVDPLQAQGLIADALQKGIVKPSRLKVALRRRRVRHRELFVETAGLALAGETTPLEIRGRRNVIAAHGLPKGMAQVNLSTDGTPHYVDLFYAELGVAVEFDGRKGHADAAGRFRDMGRDNRAATLGLITLRYGWSDVRYRACETAAQIATVFHQRGWQGELKPCASPKCSVLRIR